MGPQWALYDQMRHFRVSFDTSTAASFDKQVAQKGWHPRGTWRRKLQMVPFIFCGGGDHYILVLSIRWKYHWICIGLYLDLDQDSIRLRLGLRFSF